MNFLIKLLRDCTKIASLIFDSFPLGFKHHEIIQHMADIEGYLKFTRYAREETMYTMSKDYHRQHYIKVQAAELAMDESSLPGHAFSKVESSQPNSSL